MTIKTFMRNMSLLPKRNNLRSMETHVMAMLEMDLSSKPKIFRMMGSMY